MSNRETRKRGGVDHKPRTDPQPWENPKTGDIELIPKGIQPGFNYNPGKTRTQGLENKEEQKP